MLVLDNQREKEKWDQAWEHIVEDENSIAESKKNKANNQIPRPNKRIKLETEEGGVEWGTHWDWKKKLKLIS